ncbi:MAG: glutamine synthetase family protein [Gammaproteobacteria bacterium]|nr:glutamine synthetase family protein [Gammaproteobacteria bacterium]
MDLKQAKELIETHDIQTIIVAGTDPAGILRGKRLTVPYFYNAMDHGLNLAWFFLMTTPVDDPLPGLFDGGVPDVKGVPDLSTFRLAPWEEDAAVVLMDWCWSDGSPSELCPRSELKGKLKTLDKMGLRELVALELEFYIVPKPIVEIRRGGWNDVELVTQDIHCYSIYEGHFHEPLVRKIRDYFGEAVEGCIPEWGQGQFEINLHRSDALTMADTTVLFKTVVKQLAAQSGVSTTFMAKWHEAYTGNSGHIHQSLVDKESGRSAFFEQGQPHNMSPLFHHYVAGQIDAFREMTLFFAPFVNSYKRFQEDSFAGTTKTWGVDNRTTALRVINSSGSKCRLENRVGGADLNPYTALAASLGAGLRGIEKKLPLTPPSDGNAYAVEGVEQVPSSLAEAIQLCDKSKVTREILSPAYIDNLLKIARFENKVFEGTVTDLERRRYFEMV